MKAAYMTKYGGTEAIAFKDNAPVPVAGKGQVLIEVHASGINPFDWKLREGFMQQMIPLQFPVVLGGDVSGVIKEVGEGVSGFAVGDSIFGQASILAGGAGAFTEITTALTSSIAPMPKDINYIEAASLPLAGVSALQALTEHLKLQKGQKILIHGGAGGIGSFAIQIAKHLGAYVATTVRKESGAYVKNFGADLVIDYRKEKFEEVVKDFDAVFDTVGGETSVRSYAVLRRGGTLVSMVEQPHADLMQKYGVTALAQQTAITTERLMRLAEYIKKGALKVPLDKIFPLQQTGAALTYLKEKSPRGKVVIKVK